MQINFEYDGNSSLNTFYSNLILSKAVFFTRNVYFD